LPYPPCSESQPFVQIFDPIPDPTTGGVIGVGQDLTEAYATGRGSVVLRAKVSFDSKAFMWRLGVEDGVESREWVLEDG